MKKMNFIITLCISTFIGIASCSQSSKTSESSIESDERGQLDSSKSANLETKKDSLVNNDQILKKELTEAELGDISFSVPAGTRPVDLTIGLKSGGKASLSIGVMISREEYGEDKYSGTFLVDKTDSRFKYVTCILKDQHAIKMKYDAMDKKWFLTSYGGESIDVEAN